MSLARAALHRILGGLEVGALAFHDGGMTHRFEGRAPGPEAEVQVHDPAFYARALRGGTVGAGEAYMDGQWSSPDLAAVVRVIAANERFHRGLTRGIARLRGILDKGAHLLRRNTRGGSKRNIREHYDLGNELFALFLDPTMTYSAALFEGDGEDLEAAQRAKLDRICRKLDLRPGDELVEIGTGWGSFAIHAAGQYGCRVTTTTISQAQHDEARRRIEAAGLSDRVTLLMSDYRDLQGEYDKLVSIEMIEAVGHEYLPSYFEAIARLLKPGGLAALQVILIPDHWYETSRKGVDFIKKHIFPGCQCPSLLAMAQAWSRRTDLGLVQLEDMSSHYARTLRCWRARFFENIEAVRALGMPERFVRMWDFYLSLCEGGFSERSIASQQLLLARPGYRGPMPLPELPEPRA